MTYADAINAVRFYWGASICVNQTAEEKLKKAIDVLERRSWEDEPGKIVIQEPRKCRGNSKSH